MSNRKLAAKIAANTRWSREDPFDPNGSLARARAGLRAKFDREVDPDGSLDPAERARRSEAAWRAHFQRLALKSVEARRAKAGRAS